MQVVLRKSSFPGKKAAPPNRPLEVPHVHTGVRRKTREEADLFNSGAIHVKAHCTTSTRTPGGRADQISKPTLSCNRCINSKWFLLDVLERNSLKVLLFQSVYSKDGGGGGEDGDRKQRIKGLCAVRAGASGVWER